MLCEIICVQTFGVNVRLCGVWLTYVGNMRFQVWPKNLFWQNYDPGLVNRWITFKLELYVHGSCFHVLTVGIFQITSFDNFLSETSALSVIPTREGNSLNETSTLSVIPTREGNSLNETSMLSAIPTQGGNCLVR